MESNLAKLEQRGHWGMKRGLHNIRMLLAGLGHPESLFPSVLLAGTNGKGSTGAFMAHALRASGLHVGWTTSPHLCHPRERIWVDGAALCEGALDLLLGEVFDAEARLGLQATYFELMITAALLGFRMTGVEIALVEVGMGGRWDSTNILDPLLTVLTNVGLDHTQHLGNTREAIGREKLCTARAGRPLVLGPGLDPDWIWPLLETRPVLFPAPLLPVRALAWEHTDVGFARLGLAGRHQLANASTALEALRQIQACGFPITEQAVATGFAAARWPGRLWQVPALPHLWLDGAHNPDGARVLADHAVACGHRPHLWFGAMGDKDLAGVVAELRRMQPQSITLIRGTDPRYATAEALQEAWGAPHPVRTVPEAADALRQAPGPVLVTGSLYLIGDLLRAWAIDPVA